MKTLKHVDMETCTSGSFKHTTQS